MTTITLRFLLPCLLRLGMTLAAVPALGLAPQAAWAQITASPAQATLPAATGGMLTVHVRGTPLVKINAAWLCRDFQGGVGTALFANPCRGAPPLGLPLPLPAGAAAAGVNVNVSISAQALAAAAGNQAARPRTVYLVLLANGGAPQPYFLALRVVLAEAQRGPEVSEVQLRFLGPGGQQARGWFQRGQALPAVEALLRFKGSGLLRARWEVVQPGDPEPNELDLTPETRLSLAERARQHRWRLLQTVQVYVSATGITRLPGPDPKLLPNDRYGHYGVLLRLEPSQALDGASTTSAPWVLPVLRYTIDATAAALLVHETPGPIQVLAPQGLVFSDRPLVFTWQARTDIRLYRVEMERDGQLVFAARVLPELQAGVQRFAAPALAQALWAGGALRWRVVSVGADGEAVSRSRWVDIQWGLVR